MTLAASENTNSRTIAAVIMLLVAGAFAYSSALSGPFIFDDSPAIQNDTVRSLQPFWRALKPPPQSPFAGRPLVNLSFAINYAISGNDVRGYHLTNIALHLLSGLLLLALLRRSLRLPRVTSYLRENADLIALACALLWEVHPILTEVVTYLSTRTEGLMSFFFLLAFYCFVRAVESPQRKSWAIGTVVACGLGSGCKEVMGVAPI
ncbi:MAG TPA: glycosyltransferase family 39 protein, partial [Tepidisphaeraceae bacterium]